MGNQQGSTKRDFQNKNILIIILQDLSTEKEHFLFKLGKLTILNLSIQ